MEKVSDELPKKMTWCAEKQMEKLWDMREDLASALRELRELRRMNEWVSVKTSLPQEYKDHLWVMRGDFSDPVCGYHSTRKRNVYWLAGEEKEAATSIDEFSHWAKIPIPLPPSPEEAKKDEMFEARIERIDATKTCSECKCTCNIHLKTCSRFNRSKREEVEP